jgi:hypothetical protein
MNQRVLIRPSLIKTYPAHLRRHIFRLAVWLTIRSIDQLRFLAFKPLSKIRTAISNCSGGKFDMFVLCGLPLALDVANSELNATEFQRVACTEFVSGFLHIA